MFTSMWLAFAFLLSYLCYLMKRHPASLPPHPALSIPIIIIGDLWYFKPSFTAGLKRLKSNHGDIFGFLLGSQRMVVMCNYDLICAASKSLDLSGRMVSPIRAKTKGSDDLWNVDKVPGVVFKRGQGWKEQRKFMLQTVKDITFRNQNSEKIIIDIVKDFCADLKETNGQPVHLKLQFNILAARILWKMCTGVLLPPNDSQFLENVASLSKEFKMRGRIHQRFLSAHPLIASVIKRLAWWDSEEAPMKFLSYIKDSIRQTDKNTSKIMQTFIGRYVSKIEEQNMLRKEASFIGKNGHNNLVNCLYEMIVPGNHTTGNTIKLAMLLMILHPEAQDRVHQELDSKFGMGVLPSYSDRKQTPYTQAVLLEVHRFGRVSDQGLAHQATKDTYLSTGHYIPKDTMVIMWLGEAMQDPTKFTNPDMFNPQRFLNKKCLFNAHPCVIPFGLGRRRCSGEYIADELIYLVFTGIMSRFKLKKVHDIQENLEHDFPNSIPSFQLKFITK